MFLVSVKASNNKLVSNVYIDISLLTLIFIDTLTLQNIIQNNLKG